MREEEKVTHLRRASLLLLCLLLLLCPACRRTAVSGASPAVSRLADADSPTGQTAKPYRVEECRYESTRLGPEQYAASWVLTLTNLTGSPLILTATLQFLLPTGYALQEHRLAPRVFAPGERYTFTGTLDLATGFAAEPSGMAVLITTAGSDLSSAPPGMAASLTSTARSYRVTECSYLITGTIGTEVEVSWRLTIANVTTSALGLSVQAVFQDKASGEMGRSEALAEVWLDPLSEETVRGISYLVTEDYLVQNIDYVIVLLAP